MKYFGPLQDPMSYLRPLVKEHPRTKRKSLFIASHAFGVSGMSPEESCSRLLHLRSVVLLPISPS